MGTKFNTLLLGGAVEKERLIRRLSCCHDREELDTWGSQRYESVICWTEDVWIVTPCNFVDCYYLQGRSRRRETPLKLLLPLI
jgi:hypothetical protein